MTHAEPSFSTLGLSPAALAAVNRVGFKTPTPIQAAAIPPAVAGKDVIGCAATGTGKTAAFVLPMLERLTPHKPGPRALVLAPTRELIEQIAEQLALLAHGRPVKSVTLIGGVGMQPQRDLLRRAHDVIVATPGRLIDHMERGDASLAHVDMLVLDEADRMLDMGFRPQLNRILARVPRVRQTMLFSATMAGEVAEFAAQHLRQPVKVEVQRSGTTAPRAEQKVYLCRPEEKVPLLLTLLAQDNESTLVFTRTKHRADKVCKVLERAGHAVARIHGDRSQGQRRAALEGFKDGRHRVLVATDIAARGIDVEAIGHVILVDLPTVPEDYVHRIGRTARAAASGRASSFCSPDEMDDLRAIERLLRAVLPRAEVPRDVAVFQEALKDQASRKQHAAAHPGQSHAPRSHHGHAPARGHGGHGQKSGGGGGTKPRSAGGGGGGARAGSWKPRGR